MENESCTLQKNEKSSRESLIHDILSPQIAESLGSEHIINILLSIILSNGLKAETLKALNDAVEYLNAKDGTAQ